ncbi:cytidylyltransferase domain-containing protein [Poseidonibacter lekithochrous]|uniref:cytidylyltransferase domain-containing protein n=1 Tax=Poseidonibacter lekithochrous TaxID=1904463 RepID=UPI000D3888DF|nr:glycosyltransferase family protein [Poseidonibacter lekithochrous]
MKINVSIEARMTSSRLPGKVMLPLGNTFVLDMMVQRIKKSKYVNDIIIATTVNKEDDAIVDFCKSNNISYFRGSEDNVFERVLQTHEEYETDIIVELTGDCPFLDYTIVDKVIEVYLNNSYDYVSNWIEHTYPIGMSVQVYKYEALKEISKKELQYVDKEHVTPEFYTSGKYNIFNVEAPSSLYYPELSITLDTKEDYEIMSAIANHFNTIDFTLDDIIKYVKSNPELLDINVLIERKGLS